MLTVMVSAISMGNVLATFAALCLIAYIAWCLLAFAALWLFSKQLR